MSLLRDAITALAKGCETTAARLRAEGIEPPSQADAGAILPALQTGSRAALACLWQAHYLRATHEPDCSHARITDLILACEAPGNLDAWVREGRTWGYGLAAREGRSHVWGYNLQGRAHTAIKAFHGDILYRGGVHDTHYGIEPLLERAILQGHGEEDPHVRTALVALRRADAASFGWLSARLAHGGTPARLRLSRLMTGSK